MWREGAGVLAAFLGWKIWVYLLRESLEGRSTSPATTR
jgi:hypothetical protein